ncbi:flagellar hook-associated protein FlgL [Thalassolituus hydrocarboniclasticus]|uniref:Flagellar hook-associated protein FlgL n=1 Tax=Thalassolituus hydrocarboniclasticus TaxID=2742796 RepID=A0ABY6AB63_9GAMM|nr:flagellar hook-associated protein FlgL [Thalassolituus hydrocarboniclasticus]UXD88264.1 flagellar hook-associated protein FlgL [Thalassolituus hydrocarboniclasticus]
MRIATLQSFNTGLNGILDNQSAVNKTQQQVSSGRRVLTPADDPIAATKILQLQQDQALRDQYNRNMTAADNRLKLEDATLGSVTDNLTRLKELTVKAGGGSLTLTDRQAIAAEVYQIQEALVDLFNTRDANGEYVFAGFKGGDAPFVKNDSGRYDYKGDEGQRFLTIGASTNVATGDNGKSLFVDVEASKNTFTTELNPLNKGTMRISPGFVVDEEKYADFYPDDLIITFNPESSITPAGPNYTVRRASDNRVVEGMSNQAYSPGTDVVVAGITITLNGDPEPGDEVLAKSTPKQSITDTIFRLTAGLNTLEDNVVDSETLDILIEDTLTNLAFAQSSVSEIRSQVGARLNVVDNTRNLSADVGLVNKEVLSKLSDVDFAEAVSRLSLQSFLLEAAQQSYTTISRLSLFNQL